MVMDLMYVYNCLYQTPTGAKLLLVLVRIIFVSVHVDNKKKDILLVGEGTTQGLYDTTITAKAKCSINFTESGKIFVLSLHCNRSNSFLLVNSTKIYKQILRNKTISIVFM